MRWRALSVGLLALVALSCADDAADAKAAAAADHLRIGELRELLTKADVEHGDCKEKEDLVKRVLESSARELLPDIELDELTTDEEGGGEPAPSDGEAGDADEPAQETPAASSEEGATADAAPPPEPSAATDEAAVEEDATEATTPLGESKLSQSKVAGGGDTAAAAAESPPAAAAAAPAEYTKAQLTDDLGLVQMMAAMGLANQMMEVLTRIAFGLGDTDRDAHISRAEATAFATSHLKDGEPLAVTLGLSGGALALDNSSAVDEVIGAAFAVCDTNADDRINATEARAAACRKHVYELLVAAPQPAAAAKAEPAAAAKKPAGGATGWEELLKSVGGQGGAAAQKPHPLFAPLQRRLRRTQAMVLRNLRNPNFNTFLAGLGGVAIVLQQALLLDVPHVRHSLRGLVGNDMQDFTSRLQNVGIGCMLAAGLARFE